MSDFDKRGADRMAREIARLVDLRKIDARSAASDAMLDYLRVGGIDGPKSVPEWCEKYDENRKGSETMGPCPECHGEKYQTEQDYWDKQHCPCCDGTGVVRKGGEA